MKKNFKFSPEFRANFRGWNNASFGDEQGVEVRDTGTAAFSLTGQLTDSFAPVLEPVLSSVPPEALGGTRA